MKTTVLFILLLSIGFFSYGQSCDELILEADKATRSESPDFSKAIKYYNIAKEQCPTFNLELNDKIEKAKRRQLARSFSQPSEPSSAAKEVRVKVTEKAVVNYKLVIPAQSILARSFDKDKILLDTKQFIANLNNLPAQPTAEKNTDVVLFNNIENRLYGPAPDREAKYLYDSTRKIISKIKVVPEPVLYIHLRAVLHHSWDLIDERKSAPEKLDSAAKIIQRTINLITVTKYNSSRINHGLAGFENLLSYYYSSRNDSYNGYKYAILAVEHAKIAVSKSPRNANYLHALATYLKNVQYSPDSVISSQDKKAFTALSCEVADYMIVKSNDKSISYFPKLDCILIECETLLAANKNEEAIAYLKSEISNIEKQKPDSLYQEFGPINLTRLHNKVAYIYNFYLNDKENYKLNIGKSYSQLVIVLNTKIASRRVTDKMEGAYDDLAGHVNAVFDEKEKLEFYKTVVRTIRSGHNDYLNSPHISYIYANANAELAKQFLLEKTEKDTLQALACYTNAVEVFEYVKFLKYYTNYSEDFSRFCSIYTKAVELFVAREDYVMAKRNYDAMMRTFSPIINEYRFDFYMIQPITSASKKYGEYLYKRARYNEAVQPLEFASTEGIKSSTEYLIQIYKHKYGGFSDTTKLSIYEKRITYQSESLKRFTIPAQFGSLKSTFWVYTVDRDPLHPYRGIDDQEEWLKKARGGVITTDITESFRKLQDLAWKNKVLFSELSAYAIESAENEKILKKYAPLKEQIEKEKDVDKKENLYADLVKIYQEDLGKDGSGKSAITEDAVKRYNEYAELLLTSNKTDKAETIFNQVLLLDKENRDAKRGLDKIWFTRNKHDVSKIVSVEDVDKLKNYLRLYLSGPDSTKGLVVENRILQLRDDAPTRDEINNIYLNVTGEGKFKSLFLSDSEKIKVYKDYFVDKNTRELDSDMMRRIHYANLTIIESEYLNQKPADSTQVKRLLSSHYNSLGWYCLLTKRFSNLLTFFNSSIRLDENNLYPYGNLPHAYMFNDQFDKAKDLYLKLKDMPFDKEKGYPTFKDAFLADFKDFEKAGIVDERMNEVRLLLTKN